LAGTLALQGGAIYHCGPIVAWRASVPASRWRVTAAGPTTSMRNEPYMAAIIAAHGVRVIIGKGGMGAKTAEACRKYGCVYLQTVGGAAALLARCFRRVGGVHFLDAFGAAEAMWELEADGLEAVVGMDARGGNLYDEIREQSRLKLENG
ncbi:MAG: fumarate hydratase C-terminal domain-containing protein, partial [Kiritimatiellaeota bacterium]|nr:fumarate hydratase C-terminal domain-containing protein [Kiritimatiellota bacterium]